MLNEFVLIMNQTQSNQDVNANSRGSLLKEMEVDSDSELPEFSLPPKSVVKRPRKSIKKRYTVFVQLRLSPNFYINIEVY